VSGEVLVVDDIPNNLAVLVGILRARGYQARVANTGRGALASVAARPPELILLDITMPDLDGYEVCRALKANPDSADIPVLFISALDDALDKVKAFQVGAADYIPKPFQADEVLARIETHLKTHRLQRELQAQALKLRQALDTLAEASVTDPLTGLRNRRFLLDRIEGDASESLRRHAAGDRAPYLLFFLVDIDHFKAINDHYGHKAGDAALVEVARRLRAVFREEDMIVRWGGEEFLGVARLENRARLDEIAERLRAAVSGASVGGAGGAVRVTASVGAASFPFVDCSPSSFDWENVVNVADAALYAAKLAGRDSWVSFSAPAGQMSEDTIAAMRSDPRGAAVSGAFAVHGSIDPVMAPTPEGRTKPS
jgi:diguanylate cyclase (GGDEF)-like protein